MKTAQETKKPAPSGKRAPIRADFKPPRNKRTIRIAKDEDVDAAADWAAKAYPTVFEELAKD